MFRHQHESTTKRKFLSSDVSTRKIKSRRTSKTIISDACVNLFICLLYEYISNKSANPGRKSRYFNTTYPSIFKKWDVNNARNQLNSKFFIDEEMKGRLALLKLKEFIITEHKSNLAAAIVDTENTTLVINTIATIIQKMLTKKNLKLTGGNLSSRIKIFINPQIEESKEATADDRVAQTIASQASSYIDPQKLQSLFVLAEVAVAQISTTPEEQQSNASANTFKP